MKFLMPSLKQLLLILALVFFLSSNAQEKIKIAVFAPLAIDEAFKDNEFSVSGNTLPKNMFAGIEFYNGIMLGIDSLQKAGLVNIAIDIYDTKSSDKSIESIINSVGFNNTKLIIASLTQRSEIKTLSNYANTNQIPFVSATFPNDGGVSNNPYFFLFNPTLRTHCKALLSQIQLNYSKANIVYVTKEGQFEKMVLDYCNQSNKELKNPIKWKQQNLIDSFSKTEIASLLDSSKQNIIIGGSTNTALLNSLFKISSELKSYKISIIGLPVWEQLKVDEKLARKNFEILYSSSYSFDKKNRIINFIDKKYNEKFSAKPSDMVYKGFESIVKFASIIASSPNGSFVEQINNPNSKIFSFSKFTPIKENDESTTIDYFENIGIQFLRKL